jgi:predicted amidophosphoribosyltransferase
MIEICEKHGPYSTFCRACDLDTLAENGICPSCTYGRLDSNQHCHSCGFTDDELPSLPFARRPTGAEN